MNGRRGEWVTKSEFLDFEPPTGSEMLEGLAKEFGPVAHSDIEKAEVDKVEGVMEGPVGLDVVDFERAIRRDKGWLNRRKIRPQNGSSGVFFSEVNSPNPRTGADIQDER